VQTRSAWAPDMGELQERRSSIEGRLGELRKERGIVALDGGKFGRQAEIDRLEADLQALDGAEGEQANRERAEAEQARLVRVDELRAELASLHEQRLASLQIAYDATRAAVSAIGAALVINARQAKVVSLLSGGPVAAPLHGPDFVVRIADQLDAVLASIKGHRFRLGHFVWQTGGRYPPGRSWADHEERILKHHLEPFLAGAKAAPATIQKGILNGSGNGSTS
jgi:hypothetical protein